MIKVFYGDKTIYFINDQELFPAKDGSLLTDVRSEQDLRMLYNELINKKKLNEIYFFNKNTELVFAYFSAMFHQIEAAGGLVKNQKNQWLFIFRHGKWDLPKGKIEKKEAVKSAAIREVEEECGSMKLSIIKELTSTYHIYSLEEKTVLKRTYWFEMFCSSEPILIPQTEEGITEVKWLGKDELEQVYNNTYDSIMEVIQLIS